MRYTDTSPWTSRGAAARPQNSTTIPRRPSPHPNPLHSRDPPPLRRRSLRAQRCFPQRLLQLPPHAWRLAWRLRRPPHAWRLAWRLRLPPHASRLAWHLRFPPHAWRLWRLRLPPHAWRLTASPKLLRRPLAQLSLPQPRIPTRIANVSTTGICQDLVCFLWRYSGIIKFAGGARINT